MATRMAVALVGLATLQMLGCASTTTAPSEWDLAHHAYPEAQEELREILATIIRDAQTGNAVGLREGHLKSDKFTKFGGRKHKRLDFEQTVAGETANITTGQEYTYDVDDLKIDVFGKVAIMTFHGHVTRMVDDELVEYTFRQTLAFLDTSDGWKIIHEHQSRKEYDVAHYTYPNSQAELRDVLAGMINDLETGNAQGSRDAHLDTPKFTKFSGRSYERMGFQETVATETQAIASAQDYKYEARDLKIDVFDDVAIVTYYPHRAVTRDGEVNRYSARQTLVFLKTRDGWKIVHEHQSRPEPIAEEPVAGNDQFFDSSGVRIRYTDQGPRDAEPIVLVHGAALDIETAWGMTGVIDALDDDYRVIALDCRGHGKSDKPHEPEAYGNEMVADIIRLLDHLAIDKAHIVGYSMGGRIVCKLVADYPNRVISAMPSGTNVEPPSEAERALFARVAKSLEESGSIRPAIDHFNVDGAMTEEQIDQIVATIRATNDTKALAAVVRSLDDLLPDRSKLEANPVPCLSVVGEGDPNLPLIRATAAYMATLEIHVIEGADHLTAFRDSEFVAAIRAFTAKYSLAPSAHQRGVVPGCEVCELLTPGAQFLGGPLKSDHLLVDESEFWRVYLHPGDQRYLGRCLVVLKRHSRSLADLSPAEWDDLQVVIRVMEDAARRAFGPVNFNWTCLMNNAFREDPPQPHVHLHFRPRYAAAVEFEGSLFEDVLFGEHYDRERVPVRTEMARAITAALRDAAEQVR